MEVGLHEETAAFAFGEEEFSDVELVFVQEQSQAAEQEDMEPQVQPPTTKRGNSAKRPREGGSWRSKGYCIVHLTASLIFIMHLLSCAAPSVLERSSSLDQKQQPQQDAVILHRLPGHALVLASHSEFFKVALSQRWRREGQGKVRRHLHAWLLFVLFKAQDPTFSARPQTFLHIHVAVGDSM
jgi:hypothetical protein